MKARVHWETRHKTGHTDWDAPTSFRDWCEDLSLTMAEQGGNGLLAGSVGAVAYSAITFIEKLED